MKPRRAVPQQASLPDQVDLLFGLFLRTYALYLYLRPMLVNSQLIAHYGTPKRRAGFEELRNALYWTFILELIKICDDPDTRTSSIVQIRNALRNPDVVVGLENKASPLRLPKLPTESSEMWKILAEAEATGMRERFRRTLTQTIDAADKLLNSAALKGYRAIRNKRIAHNELVRDELGVYGFFAIDDLKLKYGDERVLLELTREVMDGLNSIIRGTSFTWSSFFEPEERDVRGFWGIDEIG
jgi:hypothetical protein